LAEEHVSPSRGHVPHKTFWCAFGYFTLQQRKPFVLATFFCEGNDSCQTIDMLFEVTDLDLITCACIEATEGFKFRGVRFYVSIIE